MANGEAACRLRRRGGSRWGRRGSPIRGRPGGSIGGICGGCSTGSGSSRSTPSTCSFGARSSPLFARLGPHPRTLIDDATADGELFEYWVHEACHVPIEHHPLYRWAMDTHPPVERLPDVQRPSAPTSSTRSATVSASDGPLVAGDLERARRAEGAVVGLRRRPSSRSSSCSITGGSQRCDVPNDFARLYDLAERVIPAEVLALPTPTPEHDAKKELLVLAAKYHGVGTAADLADYHRLKHTRDAVRRTGRGRPAARRSRSRGGRSRRISIPTPKIPRRIEPRRCSVRSTRSSGSAIATERLFGFHYRIEIYTPKPQAQVRLLRAAVPARRRHRRSGRPQGRPRQPHLARPERLGRTRHRRGRGRRPSSPGSCRSMAGWLGLEPDRGRRRRRPQPRTSCSRSGRRVCSAHRSVRVRASPAGRTATASATGNHGSRSGQRAHRGSSATAAAARHRKRTRAGVGASAAARAGSGQRSRLRACRGSSRRYERIWSAAPASIRAVRARRARGRSTAIVATYSSASPAASGADRRTGR